MQSTVVPWPGLTCQVYGDVAGFGPGLTVRHGEADIEAPLPPSAHALIVLHQTRCQQIQQFFNTLFGYHYPDHQTHPPLFCFFFERVRGIKITTDVQVNRNMFTDSFKNRQHGSNLVFRTLSSEALCVELIKVLLSIKSLFS